MIRAILHGVLAATHAVDLDPHVAHTILFIAYLAIMLVEILECPAIRKLLRRRRH